MSNAKRSVVLAYGSLLAHPGDWFGANMESLVRCDTPFGVEYLGRANQRRGGAPTLVRTKNGKPVYGGLILLRDKDRDGKIIDLAEVKKRLMEREGTTNSDRVKDDIDYLGYRVVYSDFTAAFNNPKPAELARAATESVARCYANGRAFMNGIRYLRENTEWGVITGLTKDYQEAILQDTLVMKAGGASNIEEAEQKLLEAA